MDTYDLLKTRQEVDNFLALRWANRHINGTTWSELLDLHTLILTRIGRDYVKTWGPVTDNADADVHYRYERLKDGACYAFSYLEDDDEWYDFDRDLTWE